MTPILRRALCLSSLCGLSGIAPAQDADDQPPSAAGAMAEANNAFALDLYRALAAARQEGNLMVSPYSVGVALGMTRLGAAGKTAQEIDTVFHWDADARERHAALAAALAPEPKRPDARRPEPLYELSIANRLFGQKGLPFEQGFLNGATKWFDGAFEVMDFTQSAAARERINGWVAEQTKDRIQDIIEAPLPEPNTAMALANAVYFKGTWATPFPERATRPAPFHRAPDAVDEVATMHTKGMFGYVRGEGFQGLELPYHGGASLLVLVPTGEHTLDVFSKWGAAEWAAATGALAPTVADVALPKFEFASDFELGETLAGMGMPSAFSLSAADFSKMCSAEPLFIGPVLHKTFVAVDEAGTEAAAATVVMMSRGGRPPAATVQFKADRPFLFAIRHQATGCVLFLGRVEQPAES